MHSVLSNTRVMEVGTFIKTKVIAICNCWSFWSPSLLMISGKWLPLF